MIWVQCSRSGAESRSGCCSDDPNGLGIRFVGTPGHARTAPSFPRTAYIVLTIFRTEKCKYEKRRAASRRPCSNALISLGKFGAGEGIRTLDPNLGNIPTPRESAEYGSFRAILRPHSGTLEHVRELGRVRSSKGEEPSFINRPKRWRRPGGNRD